MRLGPFDRWNSKFCVFSFLKQSEVRRPPAPGMPPFRNPNVDPLRGSGRMSLRQQQVMQLRREISHPGGVRIQLRRKDCLSSIAFVDAFGTAW